MPEKFFPLSMRARNEMREPSFMNAKKYGHMGRSLENNRTRDHFFDAWSSSSSSLELFYSSMIDFAGPEWRMERSECSIWIYWKHQVGSARAHVKSDSIAVREASAIRENLSHSCSIFRASFSLLCCEEKQRFSLNSSLRFVLVYLGWEVWLFYDLLRALHSAFHIPSSKQKAWCLVCSRFYGRPHLPPSPPFYVQFDVFSFVFHLAFRFDFLWLRIFAVWAVIQHLCIPNPPPFCWRGAKPPLPVLGDSGGQRSAACFLALGIKSRIFHSIESVFRKYSNFWSRFLRCSGQAKCHQPHQIPGRRLSFHVKFNFSVVKQETINRCSCQLLSAVRGKFVQGLPN